MCVTCQTGVGFSAKLTMTGLSCHFIQTFLIRPAQRTTQHMHINNQNILKQGKSLKYVMDKTENKEIPKNYYLARWYAVL